MSQDTHAVIDLAHRLADASRAILRSYYRRKLAVDIKSDASPVTQADREAEAAIRKLINAAFPHHGIFGEEFGKERADAEYVWVLDPLDGTRAFVTGRPTFGTLIALTRNGAPLTSDWRPAVGSYAINSDCTGTAQIIQSDGSPTLNLRLVVVEPPLDRPHPLEDGRARVWLERRLAGRR